MTPRPGSPAAARRSRRRRPWEISPHEDPFAILRPRSGAASPSSSGLGLRPFKAATRVRVPLGTPGRPRTPCVLGPAGNRGLFDEVLSDFVHGLVEVLDPFAGSAREGRVFARAVALVEHDDAAARVAEPQDLEPPFRVLALPAADGGPLGEAFELLEVPARRPGVPGPKQARRSLAVAVLAHPANRSGPDPSNQDFRAPEQPVRSR